MKAPDDPGAEPAEPAQPADSAGLSARVAARVEEIVRAAERETAVVHRDLETQRSAAEREAHAYLADVRRRADAELEDRIGRLLRLSDELLERGERMRGEFDELIASLRAARREAEAPPPPLATSTPVDEHRPAAPEPREDSARLVAIELAVSGRTRDEVADHLREAFGVSDTGDLLDEVFGMSRRGSGGSRWPTH